MYGKGDIERLGFTVVAQTKHPKGVSYDAHYTGGKVKKFMVRGPVAEDGDAALAGLYWNCLVEGISRGA